MIRLIASEKMAYYISYWLIRLALAMLEPRANGGQEFGCAATAYLGERELPLSPEVDTVVTRPSTSVKTVGAYRCTTSGWGNLSTFAPSDGTEVGCPTTATASTSLNNDGWWQSIF